MKYKFDHNMLLKLALDELKTTKEKFEQKCYSKLGLKKAKLAQRIVETLPGINPETNEPLHSHTVIWSTPTHNIMTTEYGRVKSVERRQKIVSKNTAPKVTIKKKRTIQR
jgi:hypothetical protein